MFEGYLLLITGLLALLVRPPHRQDDQAEEYHGAEHLDDGFDLATEESHGTTPLAEQESISAATPIVW